MTEAQLMAAVIELAQTFKWRTYHTHDSRRSAAGFPDLVMVRDSQLIFAELKSDKGELRPEQMEWLDALDMVCIGNVDVGAYLWRPEDWTNGKVEGALR